MTVIRPLGLPGLLTPIGPVVLAEQTAVSALLNMSTTGSTDLGGEPDLSTSLYTPGSNSLQVAIFAGLGQRLPAPSTAYNSNWVISSGGGLTWTQRQISGSTLVVGTDFSSCCGCWTAPVGSGVQSPIQVNLHHGTSGNGCIAMALAILELTGVNTSSPIGASIIGANSQGNTSVSLTLSHAPAESSVVIGYRLFVASQNVDLAATPGTGWTEVMDTGTTPHLGLQVQQRSESTSSTVAWADLCEVTPATVEVSIACALEFVAA